MCHRRCKTKDQLSSILFKNKEANIVKPINLIIYFMDLIWDDNTKIDTYKIIYLLIF